MPGIRLIEESDDLMDVYGISTIYCQSEWKFFHGNIGRSSVDQLVIVEEDVEHTMVWIFDDHLKIMQHSFCKKAIYLSGTHGAQFSSNAI